MLSSIFRSRNNFFAPVVRGRREHHARFAVLVREKHNPEGEIYKKKVLVLFLVLAFCLGSLTGCRKENVKKRRRDGHQP
jgi:hypothetical protein